MKSKSPYRKAKDTGVGRFPRLNARDFNSKHKASDGPRPADSYRGARRNAWFGR